MADFLNGDVVFDRFEIKARLGRGGMGVVYLAHDREHNRQVALKTILARYSTDANAVRRFIREVKAMLRNDHPCIVKILEAREHEGRLYYTMEYIQGQSLRKMLQERERLGLGSTVRVLGLLCHALQHIHEHTIHRDISPENVMIQENGHLKLLDFGLSKLAEGGNPFTRPNIALGKRQYCAPEQRADAMNVDLRADLYSVGVMFYECLSGRMPLLRRPITELVSGLSPGFDAFMDVAMAENPEDRFGSAREMRKAMQALYAQTHDAGGKPLDLGSQFEADRDFG